MSGPVTQFDNIFHGLSSDLGSTCTNIPFFTSLTASSHLAEMRVAHSGIAWKGTIEDVVYVQVGDLKWAQWLRVARGFQLRLGRRDHSKEKFDGFAREVRVECSKDDAIFTGDEGPRKNGYRAQTRLWNHVGDA